MTGKAAEGETRDQTRQREDEENSSGNFLFW
jgi:hypothetical protein